MSVCRACRVYERTIDLLERQLQEAQETIRRQSELLTQVVPRGTSPEDPLPDPMAELREAADAGDVEAEEKLRGMGAVRMGDLARSFREVHGEENDDLLVMANAHEARAWLDAEGERGGDGET